MPKKKAYLETTPDNSHVEEPYDIEAYPDSSLHFYYSRKERLEKASPRIRKWYEDRQKAPRRGAFFRSFTDTKPKLMLFITIIVLCLVITIVTRLL
jgi:hypothetical protein